MSSFGQRLLNTFEQKGQLCIGIDPSIDQLRFWGLPISAEGAKSFSFSMLDAAQDKVGIVKFQVGFFEQFGPEGFSHLSELLADAKARDLVVIADAKRGDVGSTMSGYATAWLSRESAYVCDALTVSPYLGSDSLAETANVALENDRGLFVLAATSNPEASALQSAMRDGRTVARSVLDFAEQYSGAGLGSIGVVVGATVNDVDLGLDFSDSLKIPVLVPGFGAQGAALTEARSLLSGYADTAICNVSRLVAGASLDGLSSRVSKAKADLEVGLRA
ncbi:MAG: orotidine-5'-phosphate decarboxylase [Actinobacteria bacterium]|uniref:Orotidine 5'-phosphate decarboxylase n=1 Tax=freshwater metagenome TaxID=449393 RepID=A0A6J6HMY6_9ZZZZ|nr:orotidine-5'-phosphate decarboxylase [Actinomycetota bacterium]